MDTIDDIAAEYRRAEALTSERLARDAVSVLSGEGWRLPAATSPGRLRTLVLMSRGGRTG